MNRGRDWQHSAMTAALRALRADRRKPTDADRPSVSVLPGREVMPIPGQLELWQQVHAGDESRS